MGQIQIPFAQVNQRGTSGGIRVNPKALSGPYEANQQIAANMKHAGNVSTQIGVKMNEIEASGQFADAVAADDQAWGQHDLQMRQQTDYTQVQPSYAKWAKAHQKQLMDGITNATAKRAMGHRLTVNMARRKVTAQHHAYNLQIDATEAKMSERLTGFVSAGYRKAQDLTDPTKQKEAIGQGSAEALTYIESLAQGDETNPPLLDAKRATYWREHLVKIQTAMAKQVAEANVKQFHDGLYDSAIAMNDQMGAIAMVNAVPAAAFDEETDRNEILARVERHYKLRKTYLDRQEEETKLLNNDNLLADAHQGKLSPESLDQAWEQVRLGKLDAAVARQAEDIVNKPRSQSDYASYHYAMNIVRAVANKEESLADAMTWLLGHAGEFEKKHFEDFRDQLYELRDGNYKAVVSAPQYAKWVEPIRAAFAKRMAEEDAFGDKYMKVYNDMTATEARMRGWLKANDGSGEEQLGVFFNGIMEPLAKAGVVADTLKATGLTQMLAQDYNRTLPVNPNLVPVNSNQFDKTRIFIEQTQGLEAAAEYYNKHIEAFDGKQVEIKKYERLTPDLVEIRKKRLKAQGKADRPHGGRTKY